MKSGTTKYRTKSERQANCVGMKRGRCVEVYQLTTAETLNAGTKVLVPLIPETECCRDMQDVTGVLIEKGLTGVFVSMRRAGNTIERVEQTIIASVTPSSDPVYEEVHVEKEETITGELE